MTRKVLIVEEGPGMALLVLDLKLPGADGRAVCRQLRQQVDYGPILSGGCLCDHTG